jgi:hypothetical protein
MSAGGLREVSAKPLKSLRAGCLRERGMIPAKSLIFLRDVCGRDVPYSTSYYTRCPLWGGAPPFQIPELALQAGSVS